MAEPKKGWESATNTTTTLSTRDISMLPQYFEFNNLFIDDSAAFERYPELKKTAIKRISMHQQETAGRIHEPRSVWHFLFKSEKIEKLEK